MFHFLGVFPACPMPKVLEIKKKRWPLQTPVWHWQRRPFNKLLWDWEDRYTRYTHKEILQANVFLGLFTTKCFLPVFATIARFEEKKASKRSLPKWFVTKWIDNLANLFIFKSNTYVHVYYQHIVFQFSVALWHVIMWPRNMLCAVRAMLWRRPAQRHVSTMLGQTVRGNGPQRLNGLGFPWGCCQWWWLGLWQGPFLRSIRLFVSSKATALRPVASKAVLSVPPTDMATSQRHECTQLSSRSPESLALEASKSWQKTFEILGGMRNRVNGLSLGFLAPKPFFSWQILAPFAFARVLDGRIHGW